MIIPTNEKRRCPRVPLRSPVSLYADHRPGTALAADILVANVSETGVALEGPVALNVGEQYQLRLCLPSGSSISGRARIVWKSDAQPSSSYGAQLVGVSWWNRRRLRSYILRYEAPGRARPDFTNALIVAGLAAPAGMVWYHLIATTGWNVAFLGGLLTLSYYLAKLKSRKG